jgi:hypothetical protein
MFTNLPRSAAPAALIAGLVIASLSLTTAAPPGAQAPDSDEIRDLLAERVEILKERMDIVNKHADTLSIDKVQEARRDYLHARLDVSTSVAERIAVLKEIVEEAEAAHQAAAQALETHLIEKTEELKAKAYVLEARLALARTERKK